MILIVTLVCFITYSKKIIHIFKKSAKDRMNELAHLFDTYEEQQQADKLSKLKLN